MRPPAVLVVAALDRLRRLPGHLLPAILTIAIVGGCTRSLDRPRPRVEATIPAITRSTVRQWIDSAPAAGGGRARRAPVLSAAADSLAARMVFMAQLEPTLTVAARAKHLLLDMGRIDAKLPTPRDRRRFQRVVAARSPIAVGERFRLRGPWGAADATVAGFGDWNGRIVARLALPPAVAAVARGRLPVVATATRSDSALSPEADSCARDRVPAVPASRVNAVRDSLLQLLQRDTTALETRLRRSLHVQVSTVTGCFGVGRLMLFVTQWAGGYEYVHEVAVVLDPHGRVIPVAVHDLRFRAHRLLLAFDADGDGIDDVAVLGRGERIGATVVLRFDPAHRRLDYLTEGFAWETL